jgi:hypothetical protein
MNTQEYMEAFGWANLAVETIWPDTHENALVYAVENEPNCPNMIFHLSIFGNDGHPVGDPIVKMIVRSEFVRILQLKNEEMREKVGLAA